LWLTYIYMLISDCVHTVYQYNCYKTILPLKCFYTSVALRIVDCIFITGAQAWWWWWLGEYVTLDRMFYILCSKLLTQMSRWDTNHWTSPSQYKGQFRCICNHNWTVYTGSFCSQSVFVILCANS
jgi:hypothetical protein